jgi:hypothetical protein
MNDELLHEMFRARDTALKTAMESLDKRLASLNDFRGAMSDQSAKMATKVELLSAVQATDVKYGVAVDTLRERIQEQAKPNYVIWTGATTVVVSLVAAIWIILGLRIDTAITPNALAIEAIQGKISGFDQALQLSLADRAHLGIMAQASTEADATGRADRGQLNERVHQLETLYTGGKGERDAQIAQLRSALVEIETQFCASDSVRNLMHAQDLRYFAMLWHKVFRDSDLTTDQAYYPVICHGGDGNGKTR